MTTISEQAPPARAPGTLIPIIQREGRPAVSARDLYRFLELDPSNYSRWAKQAIADNTFAAEGEDWMRVVINDETPTGGKIDREDFALTLPFAKKLAMMSKSARGEQVRDYFIECERRLSPGPRVDVDLSDPLVTARLLQDTTTRFIEAETAKREALALLADQAPAVAFARKVEFSPIDVSIGTFAKAIGWGPNKLHEELRRRGYMFRRDGHPLPKQAFVSQGLFTVKEKPVGDRVFPVTAITGKGQVRLARELGVDLQSANELSTPQRLQLEPLQ